MIEDYAHFVAAPDALDARLDCLLRECRKMRSMMRRRGDWRRN